MDVLSETCEVGMCPMPIKGHVRWIEGPFCAAIDKYKEAVHPGLTSWCKSKEDVKIVRMQILESFYLFKVVLVITDQGVLSLEPVHII